MKRYIKSDKRFRNPNTINDVTQRLYNETKYESVADAILDGLYIDYFLDTYTIQNLDWFSSNELRGLVIEEMKRLYPNMVHAYGKSKDIKGVSSAKSTRRFRDTEDGYEYTLEELKDSYKEIKEAGETEAETFEDYLTNCLDKNGFLEEIDGSAYVKSVNYENRDYDITQDLYDNTKYKLVRDVIDEGLSITHYKDTDSYWIEQTYYYSPRKVELVKKEMARLYPDLVYVY